VLSTCRLDFLPCLLLIFHFRSCCFACCTPVCTYYFTCANLIFSSAIVDGLHYEIRGFYTYENISSNMVIANDVELKSTVKTNQIDPLTTVVPRYYFKFTDFSHVLSPGKGSQISTGLHKPLHFLPSLCTSLFYN